MAEVESDRLRHMNHIVKQLATFHSERDLLDRRLHNLRISDPASETGRARPLSACDVGEAAARARKKGGGGGGGGGGNWDELSSDIRKLLKLTSVVTDENLRLRSAVAAMEAEAKASTAAQQQQQQQPVASSTGRSESDLQRELDLLRKDKERLEQENAELRQVNASAGAATVPLSNPESDSPDHGAKQEDCACTIAALVEGKALSILQEKHHLQDNECRFVSEELSRIVADALTKLEQELVSRRLEHQHSTVSCLEEETGAPVGCVHYILPATAVSTFVVAIAISYYARASKHSTTS